MKTIRAILYIIGCLFLVSSCINFDWDENSETDLSAFSIDGADFNVVVTGENKEEVQPFEWGKSHAANHSMVFYKVQFSMQPDFAPIFHTLETKSLGSQNFINLTNRELNQIAEKGNIAQSTAGTIYWRVKASNGITEIWSDNSGKFTISRPLGYAYNPDKLYLMGSATEAGDDIEKAIPLKMVAEDTATGLFEIFTVLKEGEFYLAEKLGKGKIRRFAIDGDKLVDGDQVSSRTIEKNCMHRIRVDFNVSAGYVAKIADVSLWYAGTKNVLGTMTQKSPDQAVWTVTTAFTAVNNNYKYKFRMTEVAADGTSKMVYWGYLKESSLEQNETSVPAYFYAYEVNETSSYCYRFNTNLHDEKTLTIELDMQPTAKHYTHKVNVSK